MNKNYFLSLFALYVAAIIALLLSADTTAVIGTVQGRAEQEALWNELPKTQVFISFQLLFAALLSGLIGIIGVFFFWSPARYLWVFSVVALLIYYRVDPRYLDSDWLSLVRAMLLLVIGADIERLIYRNRKGDAEVSVLRDYGVLLLSFLVVSLVVRLIMHDQVSELFHPSLRDVFSYLILYLSGFLGASVLWGAASGLFEKNLDAEEDRIGPTRKTVVLSFCSAALFFVLVTFISLDASFSTRLFWAAFSPVLPLFLAVYAPITWFSTEGTAQIFSNEILAQGFLSDGSARLFLGLTFQYLSIFTATIVACSIKRHMNKLLLALAHLSLLIYWLPAWWFVRQLSEFYSTP